MTRNGVNRSSGYFDVGRPQRMTNHATHPVSGVSFRSKHDLPMPGSYRKDNGFDTAYL